MSSAAALAVALSAALLLVRRRRAAPAARPAPADTAADTLARIPAALLAATAHVYRGAMLHSLSFDHLQVLPGNHLRHCERGDVRHGEQREDVLGVRLEALHRYASLGRVEELHDLLRLFCLAHLLLHLGFAALLGFLQLGVGRGATLPPRRPFRIRKCECMFTR